MSSDAAAAEVFYTIHFTNTGTVTCTLYGYPGVAYAGGARLHQIGLPARESPLLPRRLVTLAPGAQAFAGLREYQAGFLPPAACGPTVRTTRFQIYPPNQTVPLYIRVPEEACTARIRNMEVLVVQAGSSWTSASQHRALQGDPDYWPA